MEPGDIIDIDDETILQPNREIQTTLTRPVARLSHSTRNLLRSCERKYYLTRYKKMSNIEDITISSNLNNTHLDFGTAFGAGIAELIVTESIEAAIWKALSSYNFADETVQKNVLSLISGIRAFADRWNFDEWEVATYKGKPAAELSFKIILDSETGDYYCGYVDLVIKNKTTGLYTILEGKSTGVKIDDLRPFYQNSDQGIGYSIILDSIEADFSTFHVLYAILQLKYNNIIPTIHFLPFLKTKKDRLEFLLTQQIDYQYLKSLEELDYWPMRGNHCITFGRTCHLFNVCNLETLRSLPYLAPKKEDSWTFTYHINDLIARQTK